MTNNERTSMCMRHDEPMIREQGGADQPTIYGRWYCPKCQVAFNDSLDMTRVGEWGTD